MVDFTTIQANPIPLSILELQSTNSALQIENEVLINCLIAGGFALGLFVAHKIITSIDAENETKRKK